MSQPRTILYIGAPKTGSSYIQRRLEASRAILAAEGWHYPGPYHHHNNAFAALLDGRSPVGRITSAVKDRRRWWQALKRHIDQHKGHLILSSEFISCFPSEEVDTVLQAIGRHQVEIVITARALDRVLPSSWQETIKAGATMTAEAYYQELLDTRHGPYHKTAWTSYVYPKLIERWRQHPMVQGVQLIITPKSTGGDQLWQRWLAATKLYCLEGQGFTNNAKSENPSLDVAQTRLLRYFNLATQDRLGTDKPQRTQALLRIIDALKQHQLQHGPQKVELHSQKWRQQVFEWSTIDCAALAQQNLDVYGELDELQVHYDPNAPHNQQSDQHHNQDPGLAPPDQQALIQAAVQSLIALETRPKIPTDRILSGLRRRADSTRTLLRGLVR